MNEDSIIWLSLGLKTWQSLPKKDFFTFLTNKVMCESFINVFILGTEIKVT